MAGTTAIGAVVHLLATAIAQGAGHETPGEESDDPDARLGRRQPNAEVRQRVFPGGGDGSSRASTAGTIPTGLPADGRHQGGPR
ncbi:hypothetical protein [Streptomyces triculaminicus]|uniref:hypothetical protein n=1 Tax=Streptomyces triculaminicus TaxID=2816232 RepID=UPI0037D907FD